MSGPPSAADLRRRRLVPGLLLVFVCAVAVWPLTAGLDLTTEDGYFYLRIAQHLAQGRGSTFDGIHPTNGYHPLWLLCLLPVYHLVGGAEAALGWAQLLQGTLMVAVCWVLFATVRRLGGSPGAAALAVLGWTALTYRFWWSGLELSLHALALALTLHVYLRWFAVGLPRSWAPYLHLALTSSLAFLARLDTLLLAGVVFLVLLYRIRRHGQWADARRWLAATAAVSVVVVLYFGSNQLLFDHPWPVSASIKRSWSAELLEEDPVAQRYGRLVAKGHFLVVPLLRHWTHPSLLPLALGLAASAVWVGCVWGPGKGGARPESEADEAPDLRAVLRPLGPWVLGALLQYLVYSLSLHGSLRFAPWYYVVHPLLAVLVLGLLLGASAAWPRVRRTVVWVLVVGASSYTVLGLYGLWRDQTQNPLEPLRQAALWSRQNLPPEARIASWNPGTLSYYSQLPVINLDGLVNSWHFARFERHRICDYWQKEGVTHVVDLFQAEEAMAPVPTFATYASCAHRLELLWQLRTDPAWSVRAYRLRPDSPDAEGPVPP